MKIQLRDAPGAIGAALRSQCDQPVKQRHARTGVVRDGGGNALRKM
jgi:hypothetical protein